MGEFFVFSFFLGMLSFLFPLFLYIDIYLDVRENRAWFVLSFYKYFRVLGGYGEVRQDGLAFHITKKFAVLLPYEKMADTRKKFEVTKGFQLYRFHQLLETGGADSVYGVMLAAAIQATGGAVFSVLRTRHPFLSLKNGTVLTETTQLKLTLRTVAVFNGLVMTVAISKKILEAILNWIRKKRSTASWKKQRST